MATNGYVGPGGQWVEVDVPPSGPTASGELIGSRLGVEPLGQSAVARQVSVTASSTSVTLTATCRRISIRARACNMRYVIGTGAQTADASTSHFIAQDERLDLAVPANAVLAVIRESAATVDGSLAVTELV